MGSRFWRIRITANNGDAYTALQELELRTTAGGANVTSTSMPFGVSSYFTGGVSPSKGVFDHNYTDYSNSGVWVTDTGAPYPHIAWIDLGAPTIIREVALFPQDYSGGPARAPKDFTIEGSPDNTAWTVVASFTGATGFVAGTGKVFTVQ